MKLNITSKLLSLFVVAALTLTSCGDDDKDGVSPIDNATGCKITEVNYSGEEEDVTSTVEYNSKGLISKVTETYLVNGEEYEDYTVYTYDSNDNLIKEEYFEAGEPDGYTTYEYANGLVSKSKEYYDGTLEYTANFTYDANKRLVSISDDEDFELSFEYNSAGNVSEMEGIYMGELYTTVTYENYDNKLTPLAAAKGMVSLFEGSSKNNPGRVTYTYYYGEETEEYVTNFAYQYNNKNLPTRITETSEDRTDVTNFTYQCN